MYCSIYRVSRMILFQRLVKQLTLFFSSIRIKNHSGVWLSIIQQCLRDKNGVKHWNRVFGETVGDLGQVTIGLLKRLFLLKRWHMIPPWGSHRRWKGMLYFLGRDKDMWHPCGDTVSPLSVWSFCFFVSWLMISHILLLDSPSFETFSGPWPSRKPSLWKGKIWRKLSWNLDDDTRPFLWKDATETCWQAWIVWLRNSPEGTALFCDYGKAVRVENMWWLFFKTSKKFTGSLNLNRTCWARWQWKTPRHGAMSELRIAESLKSFLPVHPMAALCIPQLFKHPWQELSTTCVHQMLGLPW